MQIAVPTFLTARDSVWNAEALDLQIEEAVFVIRGEMACAAGKQKWPECVKAIARVEKLLAERTRSNGAKKR